MRFKFFPFFGSLLVITSLFAFTGAAVAQEGGVDARVGASVSPDQFVFGGGYQTQPLLPKLTFWPNLEIGLGSNRTTVDFNFELAYFVPVRSRDYDIFLGAGPALLVYDRHNDDTPGNGTSAEGGFNLLGGVMSNRGLFGEVKIGLIDSPDFKITVGWLFH